MKRLPWLITLAAVTIAGPALAQDPIQRGAALFDKGDLDGALRAFEEAGAAHPKDAQPLYLQGVVWSAMGNASRSTQAYRAALKVEPRHAEAANNLALILATG